MAVLGSPEVAIALEEAGISAKQLAATVDELRGKDTKVRQDLNVFVDRSLGRCTQRSNRFCPQ